MINEFHCWTDFRCKCHCSCRTTQMWCVCVFQTLTNASSSVSLILAVCVCTPVWIQLEVSTASVLPVTVWAVIAGAAVVRSLLNLHNDLLLSQFCRIISNKQQKIWFKSSELPSCLLHPNSTFLFTDWIMWNASLAAILKQETQNCWAPQ